MFIHRQTGQGQTHCETTISQLFKVFKKEMNINQYERTSAKIRHDVAHPTNLLDSRLVRELLDDNPVTIGDVP